MLTAKVLLATAKGLLRYLLRHWREVAVLLIMLAIWLHGDHHGDTRRDREWSARWHKHIAEDSALAVAAERAARQQEQGWSSFFDMTVNNLETEQNATDKKLAAALARHRAGGLRLPACPAGVPEGAADPAGGAQAATGELPRSTDQPLGEFLLTEAARADDVALQLGACQAILSGIR